MEINAVRNQSSLDYSREMKAAAGQRTEDKADQAREKVAENIQGDAYVKGSESGSGLYKLSRDAEGKNKVVFDDPEKRAQEQTGQKADPAAAPAAVEGSGKEAVPAKPDKDMPGKKDEDVRKTKVSTDRVDQEIKKLKAEKQSLAQQFGKMGDNEEQKKKLEQQLAAVEAELAAKDNDTYRRQHADFSEVE